GIRAVLAEGLEIVLFRAEQGEPVLEVRARRLEVAYVHRRHADRPRGERAEHGIRAGAGQRAELVGERPRLRVFRPEQVARPQPGERRPEPTPVADLVAELDGARERLRGLVGARPLARPQHLAELELKPELERAAVDVRPGAAKQLHGRGEAAGGRRGGAWPLRRAPRGRAPSGPPGAGTAWHARDRRPRAHGARG